MLMATVPLWTVLFAGIWERLPNRIEWAGLVTGILGVALLNLEKGVSGNLHGVVWILGGSASWGLGSALSRRLAWLEGPMATAAQMLSGGVVLLLLSLLAGEKFSGIALGAMVVILCGVAMVFRGRERPPA